MVCKDDFGVLITDIDKGVKSLPITVVGCDGWLYEVLCNIGHSSLDCRPHVLRNKVFVVPGTHADKPSGQKSFLLQCGKYSMFWCICALHSAALVVRMVLIYAPILCSHLQGHRVCLPKVYSTSYTDLPKERF